MSIKSHSSFLKASSTLAHSALFVLLIVYARIPILEAISIWLRIKDNSGLMSKVGPAPCSRNNFVARKYTRLFPQPVRCTINARCFLTATIPMASHCPGRKSLSCPIIWRRRWRACSCRFMLDPSSCRYVVTSLVSSPFLQAFFYWLAIQSVSF